MYLIHHATQEKIFADIQPISKSILKKELAKKSFSFDWLQESQHEIFAISLQNDKKIVGLMALVNCQSLKERMIIL